VDGEQFEIQPDEVEARAEARSGLEVVAEGAILAALKTELTPELVQEGLAREFVRRVQDLRKQAGFDIADRIKLYVNASSGLAGAVEKHRDYIMGETLSVEMASKAPPTGATRLEVEFDGEQVAFGITKIEI
jgi:isoleucyl-tRNA synthetase